MLISYDEIFQILKEYNITITGVVHIGAHECEEIYFYEKFLKDEDIIWIEAIEEKVIQMRNLNYQNVYNHVISDKDDEIVVFNVSNNIQSSSILDLELHKTEHPHVYYVSSFEAKTITMNTFFKNNSFDKKKYNFWNIDIQGAELLALKGSTELLEFVNVLYLEVNEKELYKNCALLPEIDDYLSTFQFKRVVTNMTEHGWGDAIYVSTKEVKHNI